MPPGFASRLLVEETIPVIARRPLADVAIPVNDSRLIAEIATAREARLAMTRENGRWPLPGVLLFTFR